MNKIEAQKFGAYLQRIRRQAGLSVRQLAKAANVHREQLHRYEAGEVMLPRIDALTRVAAVLDVPIADMLKHAAYPTTTEPLPSFTPYLRARYDLPETAVVEMEALFSRLAREHGIDGPVDKEDEQV